MSTTGATTRRFPAETAQVTMQRDSSTRYNVVVIGGGPIGCELAQVFQRLGVAVTLLENGPQLLPGEDPEVAAFVEARLRDGWNG